MAVVYELATITAAAANAAAYIEAIGNGTRRAKVREVELFSQAATTALRTQWGRPAASGITPTSPKTVLAQDPADAAGTVTTAIAWGTAPTAPTNAMREVSFNNVIGSGVIWTWPADGEFVIPATGIVTAVVWNASAGVGPLMSFTIVEVE